MNLVKREGEKGQLSLEDGLSARVAEPASSY